MQNKNDPHEKIKLHTKWHQKHIYIHIVSIIIFSDKCTFVAFEFILFMQLQTTVAIMAPKPSCSKYNSRQRVEDQNDKWFEPRKNTHWKMFEDL